MIGPITRDPNERPEISQDMIDYAKHIGWVIVCVTCEIPATEDSAQELICFVAVVPSVPRANELLALENGAICRVQQVIYRAVTTDGIIRLTPNVYAVFEGQAKLSKLQPESRSTQ